MTFAVSTAELSEHEFITPPQLSLSGLVPGILTNRLALRTRAPCREEGEEGGDVDIVVVPHPCCYGDDVFQHAA